MDTPQAPLLDGARELAPGAAPAEERVWFTPPIDIYETADGLILLADLPGVSLDTLEVHVQDSKLTIFGRVVAQVSPEARLLYREYAVGDFVRSFILSDEVDHERITAKLAHGVLELFLPTAPHSAPRRIPVNGDSANTAES